MRKKSLIVQILQSDLIWEDETANLNAFAKQIRVLPEGDLVLLPEMFASGFSMRPEILADAEESIVTWMQAMAIETGKAICGSAMVRDQGAHFNRLYFVQPDGVYEYYDKRHLFTLGNEPSFYHAGNKRVIITYLGWKILPLICYDLRFPVFSRNDMGYDLLIYVANWPEKRAHHWSCLLQARAIENQCYVAACNRVGEDGNGINHSGDSCVIDFKGDYLAQYAQKQGLVQAELFYQELLDAREKFPVLNDADDFSADWK